MLGTKEISELLGVKAVTVRKYAAALEKAGYIVSRSGSNHRTYSEEDATAFRELQALCERSGMTVEVAAEVVAARHQRASESVAPAVIPQNQQESERYAERYEQMLQAVGSLLDQNEVQAAELARVHKRMDDQNANMAVILREVMETRRMVAAANEKRWWQFWRKDLALPDLNDPETVWKLENRR